MVSKTASPLFIWWWQLSGLTWRWIDRVVAAAEVREVRWGPQIMELKPWGTNLAVDFLCHPFCAEFLWDPGLVGGRRNHLQKHAATDNNPVIFSALVVKQGGDGDVETIMRCEKWRLSLHTFWGSNSFSCSLLIFENSQSSPQMTRLLSFQVGRVLPRLWGDVETSSPERETLWNWENFRSTSFEPWPPEIPLPRGKTRLSSVPPNQGPPNWAGNRFRAGPQGSRMALWVWRVWEVSLQRSSKVKPKALSTPGGVPQRGVCECVGRACVQGLMETPYCGSGPACRSPEKPNSITLIRMPLNLTKQIISSRDRYCVGGQNDFASQNWRLKLEMFG